MKNDNKETLSQLMDGEWQDLNAAQSVEAACADEELKATWSRYHLIRDVIRNDEIRVDTGLCARISQAIEDEPAYSNVSAIGSRGDANVESGDTVQTESIVAATNAPAKKSSPWVARFGGLAVAASVALATVVGLNVWQGAPDSVGSGPAIADNQQSIGNTTTDLQPVADQTIVPGVVLPEVDYVSNKGSYWVTPEATRSAEAERRLNMLLSAHIESSPTAERSGMLPYSRLVGYDSVTSE